MPTSTEIARALKAAREAKGLSQRALSERSGLTQAQISKVENAGDVRLSSLVELARALDLEIALVPRRNMPAVLSITRGFAEDHARPAYTLDDDGGDDG